MRARLITGVDIGVLTTTLRLECGHHRSVGGGIWMSGKRVTRAMIGEYYECGDGSCGVSYIGGGR